MLELIGVLISFIIILILIRFKINFGFSLIIGSIILSIFALAVLNEPLDVADAFSKAIIYSFQEQKFYFETLELAILMTLIFILAKIMQVTGSIEKLINSLRGFFKRGGTLGVIPAIYGLMPVPGGAYFSVPSIDKEGDKYKLSKDQKNFLNVWFRHIWFPIYPISSAMILICSIEFSNIDIFHLIIANIPGFIAFILIGLIFLKIFIKKNGKDELVENKNKSGLIFLIPPLIPFLIYFSIYIIGFSDIKNYQIEIFIIGVIISILLMYFFIEKDINEYLKLIKKCVSFKLAFAILGIMIFREIFTVSNADQALANYISVLPFHPIIIVILIPMILGLLTGYNLGAIALSYFLVEPFFEFTSLNIIGLTSIIFMSSLVGYLVSPIHLCNVVSSEYLKTDTTRMYKMYIPAVTMLLAVQIIFIYLFYMK